MFEFLSVITDYIIPFIVVISVVVFVHEWGHFIVARMCGVRVDAFSIGFGPEVWGRTAKSGTRWRISALPLGGYVKMFGDMDPASQPDESALKHMTETEKLEAFHYKPLWQKAAIVLAGPGINFIFAIFVFIGFFTFVGYPQTLPVVGEIVEDSLAAEIGLMPGDVFVEVEGEKVEYFKDVQRIVSIHPGLPLKVTMRRGEEMFQLTITPRLHKTTDALGNDVTIGLLGVSSTDVRYDPLPISEAIPRALDDTWGVVTTTVTAIKQIIVGQRGTEDLGGVIKIAKYSGQSAEQGLPTVIWLMAMLSINLGFINLMPVPLLDGGHLMFYLLEALRGQPLNERWQGHAYQLGFFAIIFLMAFTTFNDIFQLWLG